MAKYIVKELSYINGALLKEGEIVEFDGIAGRNLELVKPKKANGKPDDDKPDAA